MCSQQAMSGMEETPIIQYLKSWPSQEKIYYIPNPGGAGDSIIALATYTLLKEMGIDYFIVPVSQAFDPAGKIVVYGGGGNLVEYYSTARKIVQKYHAHAKRLVILPHTINANEDLLGKLGSNVDVICREVVSYEHVRKFAPGANVLLMDDIAFSLDMKNIVRKMFIPLEKQLLPFQMRDFLMTVLMLLKQWSGKILERGDWKTLNVFRKDLEGTRSEFPRDNVDLSILFSHWAASEMAAYSVTHRILRVINHYQTVRTDRLHVCIAAAKLGKKVEFFPNKYYKCEAVYQYSMRAQYPNVHWMG
jgi:exopolysaccharide biosynthesis predicted pyruvyltransferase EpsI